MISPELKAHLQQGVTTMAVIWKVIRRDGTKMGFTTGVATFNYDDESGDGPIAYKASTGASPSQVRSSLGTGIDNSRLVGFIDSNDVTDDDLFNGVYDRAYVTVMLLNYKDITKVTLGGMGHKILTEGFIGEVSMVAHEFSAETRSLSQGLSQAVGYTVSPLCQVDLYSSKCGLDMEDFKETGWVNGAEDITDHSFYSSALVGMPVNRFALGLLKFTSGLNTNFWADVKSSGDDGLVQVQLSLPYLPEAGDTFDIYWGCDHRLSTCINIFDNVLRFRGFPFVPGVDATLRIIPG